MKECICSTCSLLRDKITEGVPTGETECIYGYPDAACEVCETGECDLSCPHWTDAETEPETISVLCSLCGKQMQADSLGSESEKIYCVDCYLSRITDI